MTLQGSWPQLSSKPGLAGRSWLLASAQTTNVESRNGSSPWNERLEVVSQAAVADIGVGAAGIRGRDSRSGLTLRHRPCRQWAKKFPTQRCPVPKKPVPGGAVHQRWSAWTEARLALHAPDIRRARGSLVRLGSQATSSFSACPLGHLRMRTLTDARPGAVFDDITMDGSKVSQPARQSAQPDAHAARSSPTECFVPLERQDNSVWVCERGWPALRPSSADEGPWAFDDVVTGAGLFGARTWGAGGGGGGGTRKARASARASARATSSDPDSHSFRPCPQIFGAVRCFSLRCGGGAARRVAPAKKDARVGRTNALATRPAARW